MHAEYDRQTDEYKAHRVVQAFDTAQFIENTRGSAVIQILAGDLNTEPGDLAYRVLIHEATLTDAIDPTVCKKGTNECPSNSYTALDRKLTPGMSDGKRIDYIMYRGGYKYDIDRVHYSHPLPDFVPNKRFSYSDHEAVWTKLKITKVSRSVSVSRQESRLSVKEKEEKSKEDVATIQESIKLCAESLHLLNQNKTVYFILALLSTIILALFIDMHAGFGLWTIYVLIKVGISGTILFFIFMATMWNRLEKNGIMAGKLAMEISLENKYKI